MLDLSKPVDTVEGLVLYGDHEQPNLVYYLPDEIDLNSLTDNSPDILLQIFYPDEALQGGLEDLENAVGSILSLGVRCELSREREERIRSVLAARLGSDDFQLALPPWEDGRVDLILLDAQSGETIESAAAEDRMVRGVVGSRRPSLSDRTLSAIFHARLDRRGTALVNAALSGQAGSLAGVLYDLKFAALRPTVDLRLTADLNRCAEFIKAAAGVQVYYVSADISTTFGKMREQGIIKVDLISQVTDPEAERMVNEAVKDFYDVLMRELFRPTVSPAEAIGGAGMPGGNVQTSLVKFSFAYTQVDHERVVEVDYRKRSAARRTHNPQAHLRRLAVLGGGTDRLIQRVPLSAAWREFAVEIAAPSAFNEPGLREIQLFLWRGRDDVLSLDRARESGLRMPATASPLAAPAFSPDDPNPNRLVFVTQPDEPPFYRWQARLTYAPEDGIDSPAEIWAEPRVSSSSDLNLFPEILAPQRKVTLLLGAGHDDSLRSVEAQVVARAPDGTELARKRLSVDPERSQDGWIVRRPERQKVLMEASLRFDYEGGRALITPTQALLDQELVANTPFTRMISITPLVVGVHDRLLEVILKTHYHDELTGYRHDVTTRLQRPNFTADDVRIPVLRPNDRVTWEALAVQTDGDIRPIGRGQTEGGTLVIPVTAGRQVRVEWLGPTPSDLELRFAKVTLRARRADGQVIEAKTIEWRGNDVDQPQVVALTNEGSTEWSVERRFEDGRRETTPFRPLEDDHLVISG